MYKRELHISINGVISQVSTKYVGLHQGSVFSSLLYYLYLYDIDSIFLRHRHLELHQYADDCVVSVTGSDYDVIESELQDKCSKLEVYFHSHVMG